MVSPFDVLAEASTVLLTTFRRDGTAVPTPVWVVRNGAELWVWTNPKTGKYKRIRNNAAVTIAPCTMRGTPLGASVAGKARLLAEGEAPTALRLVTQKYGLMGRFAVWQAGLGVKLRGWPATSGVAITLD